MNVAERDLRGFCRHTGLEGVVGCTRSVDWTESAAFDLVLLSGLLGSSRLEPLYTRLRSDHPRSVDSLGLRMATAAWAAPPRPDPRRGGASPP